MWYTVQKIIDDNKTQEEHFQASALSRSTVEADNGERK